MNPDTNIRRPFPSRPKARLTVFDKEDLRLHAGRPVGAELLEVTVVLAGVCAILGLLSAIDWSWLPRVDVDWRWLRRPWAYWLVLN